MAEEPIFDIKIKLRDIKQLFNSLDPSPFYERDIDKDAAEYIIGSVKEHSFKRKMRIVIHLPLNEFTPEAITTIKQSIRNYFSYQLDILGKKLKNLLKEGRQAFLTGISFLIICLSLSEFSNVFLYGFLSRILSEGFIIAGWVGLWKPIGIFLYDWWPIERERKIYEKIKDMGVVVKVIKEK